MSDIGTANGKPSMIDLAEHESRLALLQRARAGDRDAIQELADRYHVRIGGVGPSVQQPETPRNTGQQEATMGSEMATCDVCGQQVKRKGLGVHKARKHGSRNGDERLPHIKPSIAPAIAPSNGHCATCLFRGLEATRDQELVAIAVRGGMTLDAAAIFVRQFKAQAA